MSEHYTITVSFPLKAVPAGLEEEEDMQFGALIRVAYCAGRPATVYRSNGDPGDPAEDPTIELIKVLKIRDENQKPKPWRVTLWPEDLGILCELEAWAESDDGAYVMIKACKAEAEYHREEAADHRRELLAEMRRDAE